MNDNDKKTFKEKWQDKRYQAKIKLSGYSIFVVIAIIMILVEGATNNKNTIIDNGLEDNKTIKDNTDTKDNKLFTINYPYIIELNYNIDNTKNNITYKYSNNNNELLITKTNNDIVTNYKYISNKYYVENNDKYILTNINKVYDIIDYEYLDIDNINNYLNNATLENDIYKVYLKDIILNNTSDKYITIKLLDNSVEIDYTYLLNILNNSNYDTFILKIHK
ncbi:MAG: hypothetical protein MR550_00780 [Bacilli bacterium]|nr:hypothetical protein [Bacilli bacterium]